MVSIIVIIIGVILTLFLYNKNKLTITLKKENIEVYENIELKDIINENINI